MTDKQNANLESSRIAGKIYDPNDYKSNSEASKGVAETHEQASDTLVEGTIDGVIEDVQGENIPLKRKDNNKNGV